MIRSRAVKRAYFTLTYTAMHAHAVRRRTAPVSYVRRHAPYGALYGYCIKTYKFFSIKLCRTGKLPVPITFTRGKARLLCINFYCYARTSGAAAHERRFPTSADTPLAVRFTAIALKLTSSFFYQALPHLIYSLFRVDKVMVCNQSGAERATTRIDSGGTPPERSERQRELGAAACRRWLEINSKILYNYV